MTKEIAILSGTAVKLDTKLVSWRGDASHYKLVPPIDDVEFVIASGIKEDLGMGFLIHECMIFASNETGNNQYRLDSIAELRDTVSHVETFATIGYTVLDNATPVPVITEKNLQDVRDFIEGEFEIIRETNMLKGN